MIEMYSARLATATDASFLLALFAEQKSAEMTSLGLSAEQLQPLLDMQYRGRELTYAQAWPDAANLILCLPDGKPVGRMLVDSQPQGCRVIDLAVLAAYQRRGIGSFALRMVQQSAAETCAPIRLRAGHENRARRLYERMGFQEIASDAFSSEMEWKPQPPIASAEVSPPQSAAATAEESPAHAVPREELLQRIFAFLEGIGLRIEREPLPSVSFLPGIQLIRSGLRVDPDTLLYPGDLLHEAGHLAVMPPGRRNEESPSSSDPAEEMAALAWSYAAAMHLSLPPEVVFHEHGYRGQARMIAEGFALGRCPGLPILWWLGMTTQPQPGRPSIYPRMLRWLREESAHAPETHQDSFAHEAHA